MDVVLKIFYAIFLVVMLGVGGCKTVEIIRYQHEPSDDFLNSYDIELDSLREFKNKNVLLVVDINESDHSIYTVWLGLYSTGQGEVVDIKRAVFSGGAKEIHREVNRKLIVESYNSKHELYEISNGLKLIELTSSELNDMTAKNNMFFLTVYFNVDGIDTKMTFPIKKTIEKQMSFST